MKLTLTLLSFLTVAASLQADTVSLFSSAATTANNQGVQTLNISQNPSWADAFAGSQWVSVAKTGNPNSNGYTVLANGTTVDFSQTFNLTGLITAGTLSVMADDTASVVLNGNLIYAAANPAGGFPSCSSAPIGCQASTAKTFDLTQFSNFFQIGSNKLDFNVVQKAGASFGLDYKGSITTQAVTATPEPTSIALMGSGLISLFMAARRRKQSV